MNYIVIPATYNERLMLNSTGLPVVVHTCKNAEKALERKIVDGVFVTTDSGKIKHCINMYNKNVTVIQTPNANNGTHRIAMAAELLKFKDTDIIINMQGGSPLIDIDVIPIMLENINMYNIVTAHYTSPYQKYHDSTEYIKMVVAETGCVLYSSRTTIPYQPSSVQIHVGVYSYSVKTIKYVSNTHHVENGNECLEQNQWMLMGREMLSIESSKSKNIKSLIDYNQFLQQIQGDKNA